MVNTLKTRLAKLEARHCKPRALVDLTDAELIALLEEGKAVNDVPPAPALAALTDAELLALLDKTAVCPKT